MLDNGIAGNHRASNDHTAQVLQTSIPRAVWDPALTPTVMTEISWPLLRSVLLVTVPEAAWYRGLSNSTAMQSSSVWKFAYNQLQIPCEEQHTQALHAGLGLVNPARLGKAVSSQTRSLNLMLGSQAAYSRELRHTQHPELQESLSASHLMHECLSLA